MSFRSSRWIFSRPEVMTQAKTRIEIQTGSMTRGDHGVSSREAPAYPKVIAIRYRVSFAVATEIVRRNVQRVRSSSQASMCSATRSHPSSSIMSCAMLGKIFGPVP